jgi:alkylation response protein AidB-like acyl-CoA dehydrogenase
MAGHLRVSWRLGFVHPLTSDAYGLAALRERVRQFIQRELEAESFTPECDSWFRGFSPEFSRKVAEEGWIGMTWPHRYGGGERSAIERHVVLEEMIGAGAPVSAHLVADRQTGPLLLRYGTESQLIRFLPAIVRGECFFAVGMSEPDSGSDLASVRTKAEKTKAGWRLTGRKIWTSHAHRSHFMIVLCRTDPAGEDRHAGLSQVIVDLSAPGISIRPIRLMTGEAHFAEVLMDACELDDDMLVGTRGQGWAQVTSELALERSGPERYASLVPLLRNLIADTRVNIDPYVVEFFARFASRLAAIRTLSIAIAAALDRGDDPIIEAAIVKDLGTRFEQDLVEFVREAMPVTARPITQHHLQQSILSSPATTLRGGTNEILRGIVARGLM